MRVTADKNSGESTAKGVDTLAARAILPHVAAPLAVQLSDWAMAIVFTLFAALDVIHRQTPTALAPALMTARDELLRGLAGEAAFLVLSAPLLDFATRLRKRPPVWLIWCGIILGSFLYPPSRQALTEAWSAGLVVLIPLVLSIVSRTATLRRLPGLPAFERLTARALIANRMLTAFALLALMAVTLVSAVASRSIGDLLENVTLALPAGAIYFAIAAWDNHRVRGARFAAAPTVMFGYDVLGIRKLEL
jgi:hypothetical protein